MWRYSIPIRSNTLLFKKILKPYDVLNLSMNEVYAVDKKNTVLKKLLEDTNHSVLQVKEI